MKPGMASLAVNRVNRAPFHGKSVRVISQANGKEKAIMKTMLPNPRTMVRTSTGRSSSSASMPA